MNLSATSSTHTIRNTFLTTKSQMKRRFKKSTIVPAILLVYLAFMAYIGRSMFYSDERAKYIAVIAVTTAIIILLHFSLKRKEKLQQQREEAADNDK